MPMTATKKEALEDVRLSWLRIVYDVRKIFQEKNEYVYIPDLRAGEIEI